MDTLVSKIKVAATAEAKAEEREVCEAALQRKCVMSVINTIVSKIEEAAAAEAEAEECEACLAEEHEAHRVEFKTEYDARRGEEREAAEIIAAFKAARAVKNAAAVEVNEAVTQRQTRKDRRQWADEEDMIL